MPAPTTADPQLPILTERLSLRTVRADDAPGLLAYRSLPEVSRHLLDREWDEQVAAARASEWSMRTGLGSPSRNLTLLVESEGRVIGEVLLWLTDEAGAVAEIGWAFHPDAGGRGFATEAARAMLDLAFAHYGLHRVVAQLDSRNLASARLCERLGMRLETRARADWWSKGEWTDSLEYASLAGDAPRDHGDAIVVSAVTLRDAAGRYLIVRKRGTSLFMQPGGKPEAGETPAACAIREVGEELGLTLDPLDLQLARVVRTMAANEVGRPLLATVFAHPHLSHLDEPEITPAAEIEEVRWLDPATDPLTDVAPLLRLLLASAAASDD